MVALAARRRSVALSASDVEDRLAGDDLGCLEIAVDVLKFEVAVLLGHVELASELHTAYPSRSRRAIGAAEELSRNSGRDHNRPSDRVWRAVVGLSNRAGPFRPTPPWDRVDPCRL